MLQLAEWLVRFLVPFLLGGTALLGAVFLYLLGQRAVRALVARRTRQLESRYAKTIGAFVTPSGGRDSLPVLRAAPRVHRRLLAELLLRPLRVARGELIDGLREGAVAAGVTEMWMEDLRGDRWWRRAEAVRALGLVQDGQAYDSIVRLLDDDHEEVRAAAVEALGLLGDGRAVGPLLGALSNASRYQRVRVVDALSRLGPDAVPAVAEHGTAHPANAGVVAEVLGQIGGTLASDDLVRWTSSADPAVRAAAVGALGTIGLDDRSYYHALRALSDTDPDVRGLAARALGRAGRVDAAPYVARLLDDEWIAAAHGARALRRLGAPGETALRARAGDTGLAGDLARQMLWEHSSAAGEIS
jgi:HEAT repeat protein